MLFSCSEAGAGCTRPLSCPPLTPPPTLLCRSGLSLADRATIIPWLYTALDLNSTPGSYERYDSMTGEQGGGGSAG